jgi:hypothetical protein
MTGVASIVAVFCWAFMPETKFTGSKPESGKRGESREPNAFS